MHHFYSCKSILLGNVTIKPPFVIGNVQMWTGGCGHLYYWPPRVCTCCIKPILAVHGTYVQLYGEMQDTMLHRSVKGIWFWSTHCSKKQICNNYYFSCYRHFAYRNVVCWYWGYLGTHIRLVIPSCVVNRMAGVPRSWSI